MLAMPKLTTRQLVAVALINVPLLAIASWFFQTHFENGMQAFRWLTLILAWVAILTRLKGPRDWAELYGNHMLMSAAIWAAAGLMTLALR